MRYSTITVSRPLLEKLTMLKYRRGFSTIEETIKYLLKEGKVK